MLKCAYIASTTVEALLPRTTLDRLVRETLQSAHARGTDYRKTSLNRRYIAFDRTGESFLVMVSLIQDDEGRFQAVVQLDEEAKVTLGE